MTKYQFIQRLQNSPLTSWLWRFKKPVEPGEPFDYEKFVEAHKELSERLMDDAQEHGYFQGLISQSTPEFKQEERQ